jgi:hypothetical protein
MIPHTVPINNNLFLIVLDGSNKLRVIVVSLFPTNSGGLYGKKGVNPSEVVGCTVAVLLKLRALIYYSR